MGRGTGRGGKKRGERVQPPPAPPTAPEETPVHESVATFPNPNFERDYEIDVEAPEWTALCPLTGQPDFGTIRITYVPDALCLELKSLKLFLQSFRHRGVFHEAVTNEILDHLVASCQPRRMRVVGDFHVRGGIKTVVTVEYPHPGAFAGSESRSPLP
jgi:7-cyano-7-deazaguanine reductase